MMANAQLVATYNNNPIDANSIQEMNGESANEYENMFDFNLANNGSDDLTLKVVTSADAENTFTVTSVCAGTCVFQTSSMKFTLEPDSNLDAQIHITIPVGTAVGTSENFSVNIVDGNDTSQSYLRFIIKVTCTGAHAGIVEVIESSVAPAYPNPASSNVCVPYNVEGQGNVVVCDIMGRKVMEQAVCGEGEVRFDVSSLANGIYLYGIEKNGARTAMRKLVVK